jgi:prepilin-type N-terminal cleavage/methylation domain-containing protein
LLRNRNEQKGFTLIELLVVIAIIGLLASVVLLSLNSARAKSRDAKRLADVRQIASAMELYFNDSGAYPNTTTDLVPNYIGVWPTYPTPVADGNCTSTNFPNQGYAFTRTATSYNLPFCLGGTTGGYNAGTHALTQSGIQ